jgi:hypothetical protein
MISFPATFAEDVIDQPMRAQFEAFLDEHRRELNGCLGRFHGLYKVAWRDCLGSHSLVVPISGTGVR